MKELTVKEIESILGYEIKIVANKPAKQLADIPAGETFKVGDLEFIVLEQNDGTTSVLLKDFWKTDIFDNKSNNYANSKIRKELNKDFYKKLKSIIGEDNIILHKVDLTADDGRKDYGEVEDYVSLRTCDMQRKYVYILDKYKVDDWEWLATAYSTEANGYNSGVRCVYNDGSLYNYCCFNYFGVRPFCILKSNIFVS